MIQVPGAAEIGQTTRSFFDALRDQPLSLALVVMNFLLVVYMFYSGAQALTQRKETTELIVKWQQGTDQLMANCVSQEVTSMMLNNVQKITETMLANTQMEIARMQTAIESERDRNQRLTEQMPADDKADAAAAVNAADTTSDRLRVRSSGGRVLYAAVNDEEAIMSGSGLVQFLVNLVALLAAGGIFFLAIDKVAPDPFFAKIAKIAIGALLLIAVIVTVAAVFGLAGGVTVSPMGVIYFAIAVIVAVVILYVVNLVIDWISAQMGSGSWIAPVKYVLGAVVLIGLLVAAANLLFGFKMYTIGGRASQFPSIGAQTPSPPNIITDGRR